MKRIATIALLLFTANFTFAQPSIDSIKAIIKREVASKRSKSIIVGIVTSEARTIFAEGVISDNDPILPDSNTLYEIGSITKVFTSLLLAQMSLKHQLNLTDPISTFLPKSVRTPVRNGREMSLLTLSTHRSGMPRFPWNADPKNPDDPYTDYSVKQLYEYVSTFKPEVDFDTKWRYSNTAYGLLGNILERVAKQNFETLVTQNICRPLHMDNTVISLTAKQRSNIASGYAETGAFAGFTNLAAIDAAGALRSNVHDLLNFAAANLGLIKSELLPAMELTHLEQAKKDGNDDLYTTMGWTLSKKAGTELLFKDGGTLGYRTFLGIDKTHKIGVVVLSNSNNGVTDIGWHILDSTVKVEPYKYPWSLLDTLRTSVQIYGVDAVSNLYRQLKSSKNESFIFKEEQLNYLGNELRRAGKIKDAIKIFKLNLQEYPRSTMVYESLGEIYKRNNDKTTAMGYFEKALERDPANPHWNYILQKLKSVYPKK